MKVHRFASHAPDEKRRLSDLGHMVEGLVLGAVGLVALLAALGIGSAASIVWPSLMVFAGALLLLLIYPLHPVSDWPAIWHDSQQRQHTVMALALAAAGAGELIRSTLAFLGYVWPAAAVIIGVLFLSHEQHGTSAAAAQAVRRHRLLGISVIIAGLLRAADVTTGARVLAILWPIALLLAALRLLVYREPPGAFETSEHANHEEHSAPE